MEYFVEISFRLSLAHGQKQSSTIDHVGVYFCNYDSMCFCWSKNLTASLSFFLVSVASHTRKRRPDTVLHNTFREIHIIEQ